MNKNKYQDFEDRLLISGARIVYEDNVKKTQSSIATSGFQIHKGVKDIYVSNNANHGNKYKNFQLRVADCSSIAQGSQELYEGDIVDYRLKDSTDRFSGVLVYDKENFLYAIRDCYTLIDSPLKDVKLFSNFGNIYEHPEFLSLKLETIYQRLKWQYSLEQEEAKEVTELPTVEYAAVDEEIPGISNSNKTEKKIEPVDLFISISNEGNTPGWAYRLTCGENEKSNSGKFNKINQGMGYYLAASLIIGLDKISPSKRDIRIHTESPVIYDILHEDMLDKWAASGWVKADGSSVNNANLLSEVKGHIDRLGGMTKIVPVFEGKFA